MKKMKPRKHLIIASIAIMVALIVLYIIYRTPIKIVGELEVYNEKGDSATVEYSFRWHRYLTFPDKINGTICFNGKSFVSLDVFRETLNRQESLTLNDDSVWLLDKWEGVANAYTFTSATDYDKLFKCDEIQILQTTPKGFGCSPKELRQGVITFFLRAEGQSESVIYSSNRSYFNT